MDQGVLLNTLDQLRADTPGCEKRIHLNNAGAALMPTPVLQAIQAHLELEAEVGGYEAEDLAQEGIRACTRDLAVLVGAAPDEIALTEHATASFTQALSSIPLRSGDVILTSVQDYNSNQIQYLSLARRLGVEVLRAPVLASGELNTEAAVEQIRSRRPRVVALTQIPTNSGQVQDLSGIGAAAREVDGWFLVDACQSVGQIPVDVRELECDFLSATARKFLRGPRGAGFLYVSPRALEAGLVPLFPDLRGTDWVEADEIRSAPNARRFETWEFAWALVLGMGAAARYLLEQGVAETTERAGLLASMVRDRLGRIPGVQVLDEGRRLAAIVTINVRGADHRALSQRLRELGLNTTFQDRVSATIDFDRKGIDELIRFSPHYYNSEDEIERAGGILTRVLEE